MCCMQQTCTTERMQTPSGFAQGCFPRVQREMHLEALVLQGGLDGDHQAKRAVAGQQVVDLVAQPAARGTTFHLPN